MKDFRGLEPTGFTRLDGFNGPYYVAEEDRLEYWHTGKLYTFKDDATVLRFIDLLARQNEKDNADVVVGPAYTFGDERGHTLEVPVLDLTLGNVGIYHAVGLAVDAIETKREAYRINGNRWDGVPQIAGFETMRES